MLSFFMAGPEMVQWELTVDVNGPFRLTVRHARGVIVEYFTKTAAALQRESEIEALLTGAAMAVQGSAS